MAEKDKNKNSSGSGFMANVAKVAVVGAIAAGTVLYAKYKEK